MIEVENVALAEKIHALAAKGFDGTPTELAAALDLGALAPTHASAFAKQILRMAPALADCKVEIGFRRGGNNRYVTVAKMKGYRKTPPKMRGPEPACGTCDEYSVCVGECDPSIPSPDPTNTSIRKLSSEVIHLKSELQQSRKALVAASREQGLFTSIVDAIGPRIQPMSALPRRPIPVRSAGTIDEHLVMHLSDGHHDQIVNPHEVQNLENYNFWVSCRRAETYVDTVIKWSQQTLNNFRFNALTILAYGDHTSGEIHGAVERSQFRNQFKNTLAIGQLHAAMYRDLAPYFPIVNVVYVPGNHGRRTAKKEYTGPKNNWDYMVAEVARTYCRDIENINFIIPDSFAINVEIEGIGFHVSHGDDVAGAGGVPWYGLQRRASRLMALNHAASKAARVRYFVCGHYHKPATVGDMDGELLCNGPWLATDAYCYNRFSGFTEPTQLLHGVNNKRGVTWRLPVQLRTPDDTQGPKRYKIELASASGSTEEVGG